jgi:hypothetical protein
MKKELKEKVAYWTEFLFYLGGIAFGMSIVVGGFYALYVVIKALFS